MGAPGADAQSCATLGALMAIGSPIPADWHMTLDLLQKLGCGGVVIGGAGKVVARNIVAASLIGDRAAQLPEDLRRTVNDLTRSAVKVGWMRRDRGSALVLHLMPLSQTAATEAALLVLIDPGRPAKLDEGVVRSLFGLTEAESDLAVRLARGQRVQAIARARGVTLGTVRTQLRAIFGKTRTKSQAGLVLLLARLATIQPRKNNIA